MRRRSLKLLIYLGEINVTAERVSRHIFVFRILYSEICARKRTVENLIEEEARRNEYFYRLCRLGNDNGRRLNAEYPDFAEMRINTHVERRILYR